MTIKELIEESYATAVEKGWHEKPRSHGDFIALMHSELSEALEEVRNNRPVTEVYYNAGSEKPEGVPVELADILVRIGDYCGKFGIDLEEALRLKMAYNKTRSHRHGGKAI